MKAKEYLEMFEKDFQEVGDRQATTNLVNMLIGEIAGMIKIRNANSEGAIVSILRELNQKWNALCRLDKKERFKKDGFIEYVRHRALKVMPKIVPVLNKNMEEIIR